jgi:hypothetical protein
VPLQLPVIIQGPVSQSAITGATVTLSVAATGYPLPFGFEWRRGSVPVASNTVNSTTNFYTFTAPTVVTTQLYRVVVRNLASQSTLANASANITTVLDTDGDGLPDDWETAYGFRPLDGGDRFSDSDGDGLLNWEEYVAGTDPTNAFSNLKIDILNVGGTARLTFYAVSNRTYTVQYTDALGTGSWSKLADVLARAVSRVEFLRDPDFVTNRSYRVITPRQP